MAFARAYASDGGDASKDLITHKLWNDGDGAIKGTFSRGPGAYS